MKGSTAADRASHVVLSVFHRKNLDWNAVRVAELPKLLSKLFLWRTGGGRMSGYGELGFIQRLLVIGNVKARNHSLNHRFALRGVLNKRCHRCLPAAVKESLICRV